MARLACTEGAAQHSRDPGWQARVSRHFLVWFMTSSHRVLGADQLHPAELHRAFDFQLQVHWQSWTENTCHCHVSVKAFRGFFFHCTLFQNHDVVVSEMWLNFYVTRKNVPPVCWSDYNNTTVTSSRNIYTFWMMFLLGQSFPQILSHLQPQTCNWIRRFVSVNVPFPNIWKAVAVFFWYSTWRRS